MKISICNELFKGWDIEKIFDYAAQLGYDGVELAPFTLGETVLDITVSERKRIRKGAEKAGIEIVGLHWLLVKPEGLYINHPDAGIRQKTQNYLKALIDLCGDLGGKVLVPTREFIQKLIAARLAADIMGVPTVWVGTGTGASKSTDQGVIWRAFTTNQGLNANDLWVEYRFSDLLRLGAGKPAEAAGELRAALDLKPTPELAVEIEDLGVGQTVVGLHLGDPNGGGASSRCSCSSSCSRGW